MGGGQDKPIIGPLPWPHPPTATPEDAFDPSIQKEGEGPLPPGSGREGAGTGRRGGRGPPSPQPRSGSPEPGSGPSRAPGDAGPRRKRGAAHAPGAAGALLTWTAAGSRGAHTTCGLPGAAHPQPRGRSCLLRPRRRRVDSGGRASEQGPRAPAQGALHRPANPPVHPCARAPAPRGGWPGGSHRRTARCLAGEARTASPPGRRALLRLRPQQTARAAGGSLPARPEVRGRPRPPPGKGRLPAPSAPFRLHSPGRFRRGRGRAGRFRSGGESCSSSPGSRGAAGDETRLRFASVGLSSGSSRL